jgi:hypothetical protein
MAIEHLLRDPGAEVEARDAADAGVLDTARRLARLPALLGPVDPALEQQILRRARAQSAPRRPRVRVGWAAAAVAVLLLAAALLTPLGQTALAQFMAVFRLGRTEVRITPADTTLTPATASTVAVVERSLSLEDAAALVAFPIPAPTYLPAGYRLQGVHAYTYPDLPAWVPQPFSLEVMFDDGAGHDISLRLYPILLGEEASISHLNLEAAPIQDVREVDIAGRPGVLMRLGSDPARATWQEVVWERDDLVLALSAGGLTEDDLLRMARSVQ